MQRSLCSVFGILLLVALAVSPLSSYALYMQNFDGLADGTINGQDGWTGTANDIVQSTEAVSGKALKADGQAYRTGVFAVSDRPTTVSFDFMMPTNILSYAGSASIDMQSLMPQIRGPAAFEQGLLVYKAFTDGAGVVTQNRLELRGLNTLNGPGGPGDVANGIQTGVWYHVDMEFHFAPDAAGWVQTTISTNGGVYWASARTSGLQHDGNVNMINFEPDGNPDVHFFIDNLDIFIVPEPSTVLLLGLGGLLVWRKRLG